MHRGSIKGGLNPHLTLDVSWFGEEEAAGADATDPAWKKWLPFDPTSPHRYRSQELARLISAYLADDHVSGRLRISRITLPTRCAVGTRL